MFVVDHEPKEFAQFHMFNFRFTNFKMGQCKFLPSKVYHNLLGFICVCDHVVLVSPYCTLISCYLDITIYPCVLTHLSYCGIIYIFCHITICSEVIYMDKEGNRYQKSTGTPAFICFHSDAVLPIVMHCFLSHREFVIHLIWKSGSPAFTSLGRRILWSTLSKTFLKSSKRILTTFPFGSRAASQQCTSSTSASTVEQPLTEPYWWVSIKCSITSMVNSLAYHFNPLESTGVTEIGCRSFSTLIGCWIFGNGQTSLDFQSLQRYDFLKLEFQMAHIG